MAFLLSMKCPAYCNGLLVCHRRGRCHATPHLCKALDSIRMAMWSCWRLWSTLTENVCCWKAIHVAEGFHIFHVIRKIKLSQKCSYWKILNYLIKDIKHVLLILSFNYVFDCNKSVQFSCRECHELWIGWEQGSYPHRCRNWVMIATKIIILYKNRNYVNAYNLAVRFKAQGH